MYNCTYVLSVALFCSYPYNALFVCKFVMIKQKEKKKVKHDLEEKKRLPLHCNNEYEHNRMSGNRRKH